MSTNAAQELKNLEDQKANFTAQLSQLDQTENAYSALKVELDTVNAKIAAIQQDQQHVEQQVIAAQEQISQSLESITFEGKTVSLRDLTINEPARRLVSVILTQQVTDQAEKSARATVALKTSYEEQVQSLKADVEHNDKVVSELMGQSFDKDAIIAQKDREIADFVAKLANAAAQMEEKDAEIERLNSQVADLRTEIAIGARAAVDVTETNIGADLGELMRQFEEAKPAIYNLRWQDEARRNKYVANLAGNDEEIVFSYLEKGKYREVTEQEAERFRAEYLANQGQTSDESTQTDDIPDLPLDVITPPQTVPFPEVPNMDTANGLDEGNTGGEMVAAPLSIKERLDALEQSNLEMQTWISTIESRVGNIDGQKSYNHDDDGQESEVA